MSYEPPPGALPDVLALLTGVGAGWPMAGWCWPPAPVRHGVPRTLYVQCRDASASANTLPLPHDRWLGWRGPWPWHPWHCGKRVPAEHIVASMRTGAHCRGNRCFCPPHHCEAKLGRVTWPTARPPPCWDR